MAAKKAAKAESNGLPAETERRKIMAAKKAAKAESNGLPAGFKLARTRLDGFFERAPGNQVQGILRGSFKVSGKFGEKTVFRIEVTEGETQVGEGEMMGPGAVIGLDETGYTSALGEVDAGTAVFVRYDGLEDSKKEASKTNPHLFVVGVAE
jgi:hypothetical protein